MTLIIQFDYNNDPKINIITSTYTWASLEDFRLLKIMKEDVENLVENPPSKLDNNKIILRYPITKKLFDIMVAYSHAINNKAIPKIPKWFSEKHKQITQNLFQLTQFDIPKDILCELTNIITLSSEENEWFETTLSGWTRSDIEALIENAVFMQFYEFELKLKHYCVKKFNKLIQNSSDPMNEIRIFYQLQTPLTDFQLSRLKNLHIKDDDELTKLVYNLISS